MFVIENSKPVKELEDVEREFSLKQYIDGPMWVKRISKSLMDYMYADCRARRTCFSLAPASWILYPLAEFLLGVI